MTKMNIKKFTTQHGLQSKQGVLSSLLWDCHLQMPQDVYHAVTSKIQRLLEYTLNMLNENGKKTIFKLLAMFQKTIYLALSP